MLLLRKQYWNRKIKNKKPKNVKPQTVCPLGIAQDIAVLKIQILFT